MKYSKSELENLIKQKKTLGKYLFNKDMQIFTSDVEIQLVLKKIRKECYQAQYSYFDGYELWVGDQSIFFEGSENEAKNKAISSWNENPELFMGYPIIYTNVSCYIESFNLE